MLVMSCPSTTNDVESCSSEGSSCTASSITTSDPSSMSGHTHDDTSKHEAPPPPPLPPPPPGAPPPPPPPGSSLPPNHNIRKKRRVRSFFWKTIPEEKVRGKPNIWTLAVRQQQYQIDVRSVEELFGQQDELTGTRGAAPTTGTAARISRSRSFKESSKDEIGILDSKRGMNVGIFLKQFKKSNRSIVEDIRQGEGKIYGAELLKDLLKLLPDAEEIKKLRAFKGDPDKLTLVDSFMYLLIQVPRFEVRIEAMVLHEEFVPSCAVMSHEINVVRVATKELMSCEELHAILHLVLQAGNIMNAGGYAGNAVGFKLSSLLSLADTKANKPGMNLLHFVAMEAKKKDEKLLKFPEKLQDVQSAARISVENIEVEFSSLYVRIKTLEEKVQGDEELQQQLEPFLQSSARTLQDLKRRRLDLRKEGNSLIDFFCEDKDTFKLDECFRIFQDFCIKFKKAVKDNMDREMKEAARQRRLREIEEKRCAWSAADKSGGFGRSSSENDVDMLTKEGLLDFFQQRSQSPHSPLGRSASARRHRHTMTSIADRELQGYLELFGGGNGNPTDYSKFNSLPRSGRAPQRKTTHWILGQNDNRELGCDRQVTSPHTETEPISPLARFSSSGLNDNEDPYDNNNKYSSVSEGSTLPRSFCLFQKTAHLSKATITGHMNVSLEKHTLVRGPQAFELPSPNNNNNHMHFEDMEDLEKERQSPPMNLDNHSAERALQRVGDSKTSMEGKTDPPTQAGASCEREKEEEDNSTVSSTTCDTPLPLDSSVSNKKPVFYIIDCTETDCSVTLDYSEAESSSLIKEGLHFRSSDSSKDQESQQDPSSLSSNLESTSPNDQSVSTSELSAPKSVDAASMTPSITADEWDTESCDTAEGKQGAEKDVQRSSRKSAPAKSKMVRGSKGSGGRGVRTLTSSENQGMRKVVPITKQMRTGSNKRTERPDSAEPRRPLRDQSTPARGRSEKATRPPRHSSMPPDESKAQRGSGLTGSRWARDSTPRKASTHKPSAKPLRNIPKPAPEEKMCRSTMRALAQAQAQGGASSDNGSSCHTLKNIDVPSFARNTVASSSRTKKDLGPPSVPSTPSRSPSLLAPQPSLKQNRTSPVGHSTEERPQGTSLRRVQTVKASSRSAYRSETPPPPTAREDSRKANCFSEKSGPSRDPLTTSRNTKPSWK